MQHEAIISAWKAHAEEDKEKNHLFLLSLRHLGYEDAADRAAADLHPTAFDVIDCTKCANCCKVLQVTLINKDITRIARHLNMPREEFIEKYLVPDEQEGQKGQYHIAVQPCPFLGEDNRCTIYEVRPRVCQSFPYTNRKGFLAHTQFHSDNTVACPAVYYIVEQLKKQALPSASSSNPEPAATE